MVHAVIVDIKKHIYLFYTLCEGIAQLDVLQSLANASITNGYVRPYFGEFTEICSAQHPLLDFLLPTKPVSNSIICNDDFNVHIITGPNGSGKSIFIRQVLLLQVMAQVSCYIPAQSAIIKPADRIFARIYLEDNMEYGASSFILEMKEMEYIMTTMTPNSLIVIDELGRSTSLEEGTALAMALLEKLANSSAYIYITSHFTLLTKLYEMYPNINLWQMITVSIGDKPKLFKLDYKYCVEPGVTSVGRYGVYLVRNVWPTEILNFVDDIMDEVTKQCTVNDWNLNILDQKSRIKYSIESEFRKLKLKKELSINNINHVLDKYQLDLQKLGYSITICKISKINTFLQNNIEANTEDNNFTMDDNDLLESEGRIEIFTPEVLMNKSENPQNEVIPQEIQPEITKFSVHEHESPNLFSFNPFKNGSESNSRIEIVDINFPSQTINNENFETNDKFKLDNNYQKNNMNLTENDECSSISLSLCEHFSKNTNNSRSLDIRNQSSSSSNYSLKFSSAEQYDIGLKSLEISQTQLSANRNNMDLPESNKLMGITKSSVYKDYVSPIVEVVEGLNNATLSWEENGREMLEKSHDTGITISEDYEKIPMNLDKRDDNTLPNNISVHFEDHKGNDHFQSLQSNSPSINGSFIHNIPPSDNIISQKIENKLINNYKVQNESISQAFSFENEKKSHTSESMILGKNSKNLVKLSPSPKAVHICNETSSYSKLMQSGRISFCSDPNGHFSEKQCSTPTSISNASKKRNLDEASTNSTSEMTSNNHENGSEQSGEVDKFDQKSLTQVSLEKKVFDNHQSPTCHQSPTILNTDFEIVVSIQETSNLKKLHESITNFSVIKKLISSTTSLSKTPDKMHLNESRNRSTPKTSESSSNEIKHSDKAQINGINGRILRKRKTPKKKFVPPNKLTAREIRRDFEEQDRKILENDRNSPNITKYLEQIIKRPTIKQIQSGTQLALIRKSNHGVQVIPAEPTTRKKHKPLLQRNYSNEDFNVSIFSDKNAKPFEEYLNSSEIDYKTFRSNCSLNENLPSFSSIDRQSCSFTLVRRATLEEDKKTFQICETRGKNIETFFEDSSQLTNDQFSYPKGTYKKKEINNIIDKYLKNDYSFISPSQVQQRNVEKNIFDKNNSNEDSVV